ncbi:hypothetical protein FMM74_020650 [Lachnospiraceae bacterium MD308]|nr:hypothetical protein [Lachnospiraceae bacterium MD308]
MKKFKWLRLNTKITYYSCIMFSLLVVWLEYPSILSGKIEIIETMWLLSTIMFANAIGTALYLYWMKLIAYIQIDGKIVKFYDLNKREYVVSFDEIKRVVYTSDKWVFEICRDKKFFAYRKIWRPYVKKDGIEHIDVLPTDFAGIRIDER